MKRKFKSVLALILAASIALGNPSAEVMASGTGNELMSETQETSRWEDAGTKMETETESETETETETESEAETETESETDSLLESEKITEHETEETEPETESDYIIESEKTDKEDDKQANKKPAKKTLVPVSKTARLTDAQKNQIGTQYFDCRSASDRSLSELTTNEVYRVLPAEYNARINTTGYQLLTSGSKSVDYGATPHTDAFVVTNNNKTFSALYSNAVEVGQAGTPGYTRYDMKMTITNYAICKPYADGKLKKLPYLGFSPYGGVYSHGIEWIDVKYEFFYHDTNSPVSVSGIFKHEDLDAQQGVVLKKGFEKIALATGKEGEKLKLCSVNGNRYVYSITKDLLLPQPETRFSVSFSGSVLSERFTFVKSRDNDHPFPYGNIQVRSSANGDITYTPPAVTFTKKVTRDASSTAVPTTTSVSVDELTTTGSYKNYSGATESGPTFAYWLQVNIPAVGAGLTYNQYLSSLNISDLLPYQMALSSYKVYSSTADITNSSPFTITYDYTTNRFTMQAKDTKLTDSTFYGKTYNIKLLCAVRNSDFTAKGKPVGLNGIWTFINTATLSTYVGSAKKQELNASATVTKTMPRVDLPASITKRVSNSRPQSTLLSSTTNTLTGSNIFGGSYYYQLQVTVPRKTTGLESNYSSLYIDDHYPEWLQDVSEEDITVYRGTTKTTLWSVDTGSDAKGRYLRFTADTANTSLYGATYVFVVAVKVLDEAHYKSASVPAVDASGYPYWTNTASLFGDNGTSTISKESNSVKTTARITVVERATVEIAAGMPNVGTSASYPFDEYKKGSEFILEHPDIWDAYTFRISVPEKESGALGYDSLVMSIHVPEEINPDTFYLENFWYLVGSNGLAESGKYIGPYSSSGFRPEGGDGNWNEVTYNESTRQLTCSLSQSVLNQDWFYGKTWQFQLHMTDEEQTVRGVYQKGAHLSADGMSLYWDAQCKLETTSGGTTKTDTSNITRFTVGIERPEMPKIEKTVGNLDDHTMYTNIGDEYYYYLKIASPEFTDNQIGFHHLNVKDVLPDTLEVISAEPGYCRDGNFVKTTAANGIFQTYINGNTVVAETGTLDMASTSSLRNNLFYNNTGYSSDVNELGSFYHCIRVKVRVKNVLDGKCWEDMIPEHNDINWINTFTISTDTGSVTSNKAYTYIRLDKQKEAGISVHKSINTFMDEYVETYTLEKSRGVETYQDNGVNKKGFNLTYKIDVEIEKPDSKTLPVRFQALYDTLPEWFCPVTAYVSDENFDGTVSPYTASPAQSTDLKVSLDGSTLSVKRNTDDAMFSQVDVYKMSVIVYGYVRMEDLLTIGSIPSNSDYYYFDNDAELYYSSAKSTRGFKDEFSSVEYDGNHTEDAYRSRYLEKTSNNVRVYIPKSEYYPSMAIQKCVAESNATSYNFTKVSNTTDTGKTYKYALKVSVGSNTNKWGAKNNLPECRVEDTVPDFVTVTSARESAGRFAIITKIDPDNGKTVMSASADSSVSSTGFYGKDYLIELTVKVKDKFDYNPDVSGNNFFWKNTADLDYGVATLTSNEVQTLMPARVNVRISKISAPALTDNISTGAAGDDWTPADDLPVLEGVEFRIWGGTEGLDKTLATDELGNIELKGLAAGTYYFREVSTLPGYVLDTTERTFIVNNLDASCPNLDITTLGTKGDRTFVLENDPTQIAIFKKDIETNEYLEGAKYVLKDADGNIVKPQGEEDGDGSFLTKGSVPQRFSRLPVGKYTLVELEAPEYYETADPMTINVKNVSTVQTFTAYDEPAIDTSVVVTQKIKAAETYFPHGNPVFVYELSGTDAKGISHTYHGQLEFTDGLTPDANGFYSLDFVFRNVPKGTYTLTQKDALGYYLSSAEKGSSNVNITSSSTPGYGKENVFRITAYTTEKSNIDKDDEYKAHIILVDSKKTYDDYRHSGGVANVIKISH